EHLNTLSFAQRQKIDVGKIHFAHGFRIAGKCARAVEPPGTETLHNLSRPLLKRILTKLADHIGDIERHNSSVGLILAPYAHIFLSSSGKPCEYIVPAIKHRIIIRSDYAPDARLKKNIAHWLHQHLSFSHLSQMKKSSLFKLVLFPAAGKTSECIKSR